MTSVPLKFCEKVGGQIDPQPPKDGGHSKKLRVIVPLTPAYFHHWCHRKNGDIPYTHWFAICFFTIEGDQRSKLARTVNMRACWWSPFCKILCSRPLMYFLHLTRHTCTCMIWWRWSRVEIKAAWSVKVFGKTATWRNQTVEPRLLLEN